MIYIIIPTTAERRPQLQRLLDSIYSHTNIQYSIVIYENFDGGWVKAVHNALSGLSDDAVAVLLGSDVVVEAGWLSTLYEAWSEDFPNGDGLSQPYDEINNGALCQHPLGKVGTIKKYLSKDFIHNFSDNWMTFRLIEDQKYSYVPESKIEHLHWANKKAQVDKTYEKVMESYRQDEATFNRKMTNYKLNKETLI